MRMKVGCSQYATEVDEGKAFMDKGYGSIYVMVKHGEDHCLVRRVMRADYDQHGAKSWVFCSSELENFNPYGDVKPVTMEDG